MHYDSIYGQLPTAMPTLIGNGLRIASANVRYAIGARPQPAESKFFSTYRNSIQYQTDAIVNEIREKLGSEAINFGPDDHFLDINQRQLPLPAWVASPPPMATATIQPANIESSPS